MPIGWKLAKVDRDCLLERFPPIWPDVVADHVTLASPEGMEERLPEENTGLVVGHVNDHKGLQALVVEIDGTVDRPDGSTYHITWSLHRERGREPRQSNDVLARLGWERLNEPVEIRLIPARW